MSPITLFFQCGEVDVLFTPGLSTTEFTKRQRHIGFGNINVFFILREGKWGGGVDKKYMEANYFVTAVNDVKEITT